MANNTTYPSSSKRKKISSDATAIYNREKTTLVPLRLSQAEQFKSGLTPSRSTKPKVKYGKK